MPNKTITQVPVAAKHIKRVVIEPLTVVGEVVTWKIDYHYDPVDDGGASIRSVVKVRTDIVVGSGTQTALQNFVVNTVVPDANTNEGT